MIALVLDMTAGSCDVSGRTRPLTQTQCDGEGWSGTVDAKTIREQAGVAARANDAPRLIALAKEYTQFLTPMFHLIPWDEHMVISWEHFEEAYRTVARFTAGFTEVTPQRIAQAIAHDQRTLVVFRTIAGYRVQELAYALEYRVGIRISQQTLRNMELGKGPVKGLTSDRLEALAQGVFGAVEGTLMPRPPGGGGFIDRREKCDTKAGWTSVAQLAGNGVPYEALLYERYLGRPFAYVVDALSSAKADLLERPIQELFERSGVSYYRSKTIDKIPGFLQAPDFLIPDEKNPRIIIEAKLAEDGGTARDKASRIERLSRITEPAGMILIAVVDGKGFFRINDVLAPILRTTKGLTFTLATLEELMDLPVFQSYRQR